MEFIKAHPKQSLLAGSLAAALIAFTVTACGGGSAATSATSATSAQGSPGHWTAAEVSQFTSAAGSDGSASQDSCIAGYFERDTSFGNAMDVVSVAPASGPSMSAAQIKAALISKYGTAMGDAINAQLTQVVNDSNNNCGGTAASSTAPAAAPTDTAAPADTADPAATSESSCTVDCVNPVATGESGWLAQVQGALQNVQQDLDAISSDTSNDPENLSLDGSQLVGDAQAAPGRQRQLDRRDE
jgi:hypothetical protein